MGLYQVDWACGAEQKQQQMKQNGFRDEMGWAARNSEFNWFISSSVPDNGEDMVMRGLRLVVVANDDGEAINGSPSSSGCGLGSMDSSTFWLLRFCLGLLLSSSSSVGLEWDLLWYLVMEANSDLLLFRCCWLLKTDHPQKNIKLTFSQVLATVLSNTRI